MNKTLEVIRFEILRSIKKPSFWIASLLIPVALALYIGIAAFSGYTAGEAATSASDTSELKLAIVDESNYLELEDGKNNIIKNNESEQKLDILESKDTAMSKLQDGEYDVFYYIPANFEESKQVEIFAKPETPKITDDFSEPIKNLLSSTASSQVSEINYAILTDSIDVHSTTYDKDNQEISFSDQISNIAGPAIALALFYFIIIVLSNRLTVSMTEEKENRISELILTSINPTSLIVGKIVSLMIIGVIQIATVALPAILMFLAAKNNGLLPFDLELNINFLSILPYLILLIVSYFFFTAINVLVGTFTPTAKDASSYSGVIMIFMIAPIMLIGTLMKEPSTLSYVLTFFPPSAPIATMLRGIFGNLEAWELILSIIIISVSSILLALFATYIFRRNAIEFTSKLNLKKILGSTRTSWKK